MKIKQMTESKDPGSFTVVVNLYLKWWTTSASSSNHAAKRKATTVQSGVSLTVFQSPPPPSHRVPTFAAAGTR